MPLYEVREVKRTGTIGKKLAIIDAYSKKQAGAFVKNQRHVQRVKVFPLKLVRSTKSARTVNVVDLNKSAPYTQTRRKKRKVVPQEEQPQVFDIWGGRW